MAVTLPKTDNLAYDWKVADLFVQSFKRGISKPYSVCGGVLSL